MTSIALATVCGGHVEQEFLLGAIEHHAKIAKYHVVLDVTPAVERRRFRNLPNNVVWVHDDAYQSGTVMFAFRLALIRSLKIAQSLGTDLVMQLDSDEFLEERAATELFPLAAGGGVEHLIVTWGADGMPYYRDNAWVRRLWVSGIEPRIPQNKGWQRHQHYNGNPERNPIPIWPSGAKIQRAPVDCLVHHHLHWAFPQKGLHSFGEWPIAMKFPRDGIGFWPEPLLRWRATGEEPSKGYI